MPHPIRTAAGAVALAGALILAPAGMQAQTSTTEVAPGVVHELYAAPGPNVVNVVRVDRDRPELMLEMGFPHARRNFPSRETTSAIAARYDLMPEKEVLAAVNGSFFGTGTDLVGSLATESSLLGFPDTRTHWPTFAWTDAGEGHINSSAAVTSARLTLADGETVDIDRWHMPRLADTIAFYTHHYGPTTGNQFQGVEIIVEGANYPLRPNKEFTGTVTAVRTGAASLNSAIPRDGFVIAARDAKADFLVENVSVGDRLAVTARVNDGYLNNASFMIDGAGWLLRDGSAPTNLWNFSANFLGRHPRTVLAYNAEHLFIVTIDGRQTSSVGMSFQEMADFLSGTLGATDAVNLDGGGSTAMVVAGDLVNAPSGGSERAVGNAVLLVRNTAESPEELSDSFPGGVRQLPWDDKFTWNPATLADPPPPGGATHAMTVLDPTGGTESARIGTRRDRNRAIEADVYLDHRPEDAAAGFERYGLFLRDDGHAAFTGTLTTPGNAYAMTFDSHDGRVRAGRIVSGELTDFIAEGSELHVAASGWHSFRIEAFEEAIGYFLDGQAVAIVEDGTFLHGFAGVAYRDHFSSAGMARGARVANVSHTAVTEPPSIRQISAWALH